MSIGDLFNKGKEKAGDELNKHKDEIVDMVGGFFSKKPKAVENKDGTISREIKVGKQKIGMTTAKVSDDKFVISAIEELDEKNQKKLMEKVGKGKKLSADEQFWMGFKERTAVGLAMVDCGVPAIDAAGVTAFTKDEMMGNATVADFNLNLEGFAGDKAALLDNIKKRMIEAYGAEIGGKRFDELLARSNITQLADKTKAAAEPVKEEPKVEQAAEENKKGEQTAEPVKKEQKVEQAVEEDDFVIVPTAEPVKEEHKVVQAAEENKKVEQTVEPVKKEPKVEQTAEPVKKEPKVEQTAEPVKKEQKVDEAARNSVKAEMTADANKKTQATVSEKTVEVSVKDSMKQDAKVAEIRKMMEGTEAHPIKMQDKDGALKKMIDTFGVEATAVIVQKCVMEPLHANQAMGEGFKRSGASMEFFAAIDPNDKEKMAKVAEMTGVAVENMPAAKQERRTLEPIAADMVKPATLNLEVKVKPEDIKLVDPRIEQAYADMCKKHGRDALLVKDLAEMGATRQDFDFVLNKMFNKENGTSENIQKKVRDGLGLEGESPVTKDFAFAVIERVETRNKVKAWQKDHVH